MTNARDRLEECRELIKAVGIIEARADMYRDDGTLTSTTIKTAIDTDYKTALKNSADAVTQVMQIIDPIKDSELRQIISMRYIDGLSWDAITSVIFGSRADFYDRPEAYKRRVFRLHARAIKLLNN